LKAQKVIIFFSMQMTENNIEQKLDLIIN